MSDEVSILNVITQFRFLTGKSFEEFWAEKNFQFFFLGTCQNPNRWSGELWELKILEKKREKNESSFDTEY